ncbi:cell wall-binding repeat-containing protein [Clostridium sp. OS1-26]|uniref:cell wall-binding repeat-containing protein n=1 Tax=Clostridium sp. OS1-26 TaxID=3070681 RepID=UPI0027E1B5E0|nr:cell wall-binding repeat-containing protein [Clostridium sp. OS1-26]WML32610.1 cell wall-binding repeat-containing protein [Clostridium sp. OS1-26]
MIEKKAKLSFILAILILFLGFSPNAFAAQGGPIPESIQINGDRLKMTGSNTGTFHYQISDIQGKDITSKIPASDISVDAIVDRNPADGSGERAKVSLDPSTGTCTLTYDFSNSKRVEVTFMYSKLYVSGAAYRAVGNSGTFYIGEKQDPYMNEIYQINFTSDYLTKTGANTATFRYKLSNGFQEITKNIPASQLSAFTSIDSKVVLDPSTGTGTITFNSPDTDKPIKLTLTDKAKGTTRVLNTLGLTQNPVRKVAASEICRMNFLSSDLIKTGKDTATFNYKILDHYYNNITSKISVTDIDATALVGSSKAQISLNPSTGTGTVTYNFSNIDAKAMIRLIHKTGVEASGVLNIVNSESENNKDDNSNNLEVARIVLTPANTPDETPTGMMSAELAYQILNKYGKDITLDIPVSQIALSSSINSQLSFTPKERICGLIYKVNGTDRTIIVSLSDKLTGVKAALNIGDSPTAKDTSTPSTTSSSITNTNTPNTNTSTGSAITIKRLCGADRYATSAAVALSGWTQSDYAILASGENFPDAISAAPLAKKYNAPILLTGADSIPEETLNAIQQLKVKNIIIVGGTGSVSSKVEQKLTSSGLVVTRIFGQDRYETCIKIAEQLDNVTEIAVVTGESFPDALSISPIAVKRNMPIILVSHNEIPSVVKDYINSHKLTTTYVIGSGTSLNNAVLKGLSNIELVTGNDEYQVNLNIIDKFKSDLNLGTIYVASGEGFADALSGSILAGKNSNPLLLVGNDPSIEKNYFANNSINISNINVLGGIGAVPDEVINAFIKTSTTTTPSSISTPSSTPSTPTTDKDVSQSPRVNKIKIMSKNLGVPSSHSDENGYATFKVYDQNGNDVTLSPLAKNIKFSCDVGTVSITNDLITVVPNKGVDLATLKSVSITGTDPTTGVSTSATLTVWSY